MLQTGGTAERWHGVAQGHPAYKYDPTLGKHGKLALQLYNFVTPLEDAGEEVTRKADVTGAIK